MSAKSFLSSLGSAAQSVALFFGQLLFNPVTLISWTSLIIFNICLRSIRSEIGIPYGRTCEEIRADELLSPAIQDVGCMLNDAHSYAMLDYSMQILMLVVATILAFRLLWEKSASLFDHALSQRFAANVKRNGATFWFCVFTVVIFVGVPVFLLTGVIADVETLLLYLPDDMVPDGSTRWPPMSSGITWARFFVGLYGWVMSLYFEHRHQRFVNALRSPVPEES